MLALDAVGVCAAAVAGAQVATQPRARPHEPVAGGELFADLAAVRFAGVAVGEQVRAGLEHVRLHLLGAHVEHRADVGVAHPVHLGEDERRTLLLGQLADPADHLGHLLVHLGELHRVAGERHLAVELHLGTALAQDAAGTRCGRS